MTALDEAAAACAAELRQHADATEQIDEPGALHRYVQRAWRIVEPGTTFLDNWHIRLICDRLQAVSRGDITRLIINIPPRYMKSSCVSVFWPTWAWTLRPETRWIFATYAEKLSIEHSLNRRVILQSDWYQRTFPRVRLASDQNVKTEFRNAQRGAMVATSMTGTVTGKGGDVVVVDDPINPDQAWSAAERDRANRAFDLTLSTRLNDKRTGAIVVIMQRLHENDLTGHLLTRGGWEHICIPGVYEPGHPDLSPDDVRSEAGELLWPEREGDPEIRRARLELGEYGFAGQYQQRPAPVEGGLIKRAWWRYYPPNKIPPTVRVVQSWDTAFKDKTTSDFVVGQVWGVKGAHRFLLRQARGQWDLPETIRQIRAMYAWVRDDLHLPQEVLVEKTANGPEIIATLRHELAGVIPVRPRGDKTQRTLAVTAQIEAGNVFLPGRLSETGDGPDAALTPGWVQQLVEECAAFPNAVNDDQVDAMTQALQRIGYQTPDVIDHVPYDEPVTRHRLGRSSLLRDRPLPYGATL